MGQQKPPLKKQKIDYDKAIMKVIIMLENLAKKQYNMFVMVLSSLPYYTIKTISEMGNDRIKKLSLNYKILDKKVWLWGMGNRENGRLGDGDHLIHYVLKPFPIQADIGEIIQVSSGDYYTMFITNIRDLYGMGNGRHGKLGDGDDSWHIVITQN